MYGCVQTVDEKNMMKIITEKKLHIMHSNHARCAHFIIIFLTF